MYGSFSTGVQSGSLVTQIVVLVALAVLVAFWTEAWWVASRRDRRALDLRSTRRACRAARLRTTPVESGVLPVRPPIAWVDLEPAERARRAGIDEIQIDDLALWSERLR